MHFFSWVTLVSLAVNAGGKNADPPDARRTLTSSKVPTPSSDADKKPAPKTNTLTLRQRPPVLPAFTPPGSFAPLVKAVRPGVVNLSTRNGGSSRSLGSGFIITQEGLLVTNGHVVEKAQAIRVKLADGREFDAELVGSDESTDVALLRLLNVPKGPLPTVALGDSDRMEIGDWVVAIGNPFGLDTSVSHGIISARERVIGVGPYDDFIQTNVLINPGNSGGPLFNVRGEVVGVCSAVVTNAQGIGFAVPINFVKDLLPNLLENGRAERGWLGLEIQEISEPSGSSALVVDVYPNSPAEKAGLMPGDRVTAVGGKVVVSYLQLLRRIALLAPGTTVTISVKRESKSFDVKASLIERPKTTALRESGSGRFDQLGLVVRERSSPDDAGTPELDLVIAAVVPGSPAHTAALKVGDILLEVQKQPIADLRRLKAAFDANSEGNLLVKFRRGDAAQYVMLKRP